MATVEEQLIKRVVSRALSRAGPSRCAKPFSACYELASARPIRPPRNASPTPRPPRAQAARRFVLPPIETTSRCASKSIPKVEGP